MNKRSVALIFVFSFVLVMGFVYSAETSVNSSSVDKAFSCLAEKVKSDCSGINKIQDLALTILASPSGVSQKCYDKLLTLGEKGCFGENGCDVRDTALAILALDHVGRDTKEYENWLKNQTRTPTNLDWILQQDSNENSNCTISYNSLQHTFKALENKKLEGDLGNPSLEGCLRYTGSKYWIQIESKCYDTNFKVICDTPYAISLHYKQPNSNILFIPSETKTAQSNQPIEVKIGAKCFGNKDCDYEASAWATLALDKTSNGISDYLLYLITDEESNKKYLPSAFLYSLRDSNEYGTKLIQQQKLNSWKVEGTAYNEYYDTGLALLVLSRGSQTQVDNAKSWLYTVQDSSGCWNNGNVRDTAMVLWATERRVSDVVGVIQKQFCEDSNYFCISAERCPEGELLGEYSCTGLSKCCRTENLESCSNMQGSICTSEEVCSGAEKRASDTNFCCTGDCNPKIDTLGDEECISAGGNCYNTCTANEEELREITCSGGYLCCKKMESTSEPPKNSKGWIWILVILVIIILGILAYIFRDKIKEKFSKEKDVDENKGLGRSAGTGLPPRGPPGSGGVPMNRGIPGARVPTANPPIGMRPMNVGPRPLGPNHQPR